MADASLVSAGVQISAIARSLLARRNVATPPSPSADLRAAGLTSLDMVNLMLAVEAEFDIEIPQAAMTPDNFRSIRAIESLVHQIISR